jgi:hypothetical protein
MIPKRTYVRSKKLLENARSLPCQHCGKDDGTVVAAHTNWDGGKGRGIKADDNLIASLCFYCHVQVDQGRKSSDERKQMWLNAHKKTVELMQKQGLWVVDVPVPDVSELR